MEKTDISIWCQDHNFSERVAALLSRFTPDEEELNSWEISEDKEHVTINDTDYTIFNEQEWEDETEPYKEDVESDYLEEVPDILQNYVDWKGFWEDNPVHKQFGVEEFTFLNKTYYYTDEEI